MLRVSIHQTKAHTHQGIRDVCADPRLRCACTIQVYIHQDVQTDYAFGFVQKDVVYATRHSTSHFPFRSIGVSSVVLCGVQTPQ